MYPQKNYSLNEIFDKTLNWYFNQHIVVQAGILLLAAKIIRDHSPPVYYTPKPIPILRKDFAESTKKFTILMQGNVCNSCKKPTKFWDFHHKNRNSSDNSQRNCEALCPYCHAEKTRNRSMWHPLR